MAVYPSRTRALWSRSGYGMLGLNASYAWTQGKRLRHSAGLSVRNALSRDLLAAAGRNGGERGLETRYGVRF